MPFFPICCARWTLLICVLLGLGEVLRIVAWWSLKRVGAPAGGERVAGAVSGAYIVRSVV